MLNSMLYVNLTCRYEQPAENFIESNWVVSSRTNFVKKHVFARGGHLALVFWSVVMSGADSIIGVGAGLASVLTGGRHRPTFKCALIHLDSSRQIIALPYVNLLKTLNPDATFSGSMANMSYMDRYLARTIGRKDAFITSDGDGFITHYVSGTLKSIARGCYNSDNIIKRHLVTRLTYVLLAITSVITRIVDGIIGVIAALASFLTVGKFESINNLAYRGLQTPGIINDLFYCTIKFMNPWAGTSRA